jgi:hypothetical protein
LRALLAGPVVGDNLVYFTYRPVLSAALGKKCRLILFLFRASLPSNLASGAQGLIGQSIRLKSKARPAFSPQRPEHLLAERCVSRDGDGRETPDSVLPLGMLSVIF